MQWGFSTPRWSIALKRNACGFLFVISVVRWPPNNRNEPAVFAKIRLIFPKKFQARYNRPTKRAALRSDPWYISARSSVGQRSCPNQWPCVKLRIGFRRHARATCLRRYSIFRFQHSLRAQPVRGYPNLYRLAAPPDSIRAGSADS